MMNLDDVVGAFVCKVCSECVVAIADDATGVVANVVDAL